MRCGLVAGAERFKPKTLRRLQGRKLERHHEEDGEKHVGTQAVAEKHPRGYVANGMPSPHRHGQAVPCLRVGRTSDKAIQVGDEVKNRRRHQSPTQQGQDGFFPMECDANGHTQQHGSDGDQVDDIEQRRPPAQYSQGVLPQPTQQPPQGAASDKREQTQPHKKTTQQTGQHSADCRQPWRYRHEIGATGKPAGKMG